MKKIVSTYILGFAFCLATFMQTSCMNQELQVVIDDLVNRMRLERQQTDAVRQQVRINRLQVQTGNRRIMELRFQIALVRAGVPRVVRNSLPHFVVNVLAFRELYAGRFARGVVTGFFPPGGSMICLKELFEMLKHGTYTAGALEAVIESGGHLTGLYFFKILLELIPSNERGKIFSLFMLVGMYRAHNSFVHSREDLVLLFVGLCFYYLGALDQGMQYIVSSEVFARRELKIALGAIMAGYLWSRILRLSRVDEMHRHDRRFA